MPTLEELRTQYQEAVARGVELAEAYDPENPDTATALFEQRTTVEQLAEQVRGAEQGDEAVAFMRQAQQGLSGSGGDPGQGNGQPGARGTPPPIFGTQPAGVQDQPFTPGEVYTRSQAYADWMRRFPEGGPQKGVIANSDPAEYQRVRDLLGMVTATEQLRGGRLTPDGFRALVTAADASAGTLVRPDFRGLLEPGLVRPLTVRQLVTVIPVTTDAVEYVRESSRVSAAAPVAEATALTGTTGTKPEGGLIFELVTDVIRTIAEWVPVTRRILADAGALRAYIDQFLTDDLALELEDQMVSGSGTGEDFLGILNDPDIQAAGPPGAGQNMLDILRTAKRLVRVNGRTNATAILVNPEDAEALDTLKASGDGHYFIPGGPYGASELPRVWGLPQVESEAIPAGTALVGDFRRAVLFDRESTTITVGTVNDDFIRNIVRVLAEMRAGFGVIRPKAFVEVDLAA